METKRIKLTDLVLNEGQVAGLPTNPRQWTKKELDKLKKSLQETPELLEARGILVYPLEGKYLVLGGNMRLSALKALKAKDAPCIVFPEDTPIDKLKEVVIKDNGSFGEWDFDSLANEWGDLPLTDWGVPAWEMDKSDALSSEDAVDDDFNESEVQESVCKMGDIWLLGEHRLMCGDSTNPEDISKLMDGELADLWLTDPPYNVSYEGKTKETLTIENDNKGDDEFREFLIASYAAANANMRGGAAFYIWHAGVEGYNFLAACREVGWKVRQCLIWQKNTIAFGRQDYQWKHEPCLYGWKDGASHNWYSDRKQTTLLVFDRPTRNSEHPTMKPIPLIAYQMCNSTKPGDLVLDSFGGSGTTMIAAEQMGRRARLMELDPHYCDVIIARWEKLTGKEAVRVE